MELNTMKLHREQRLPGPFASPWLVIGGAVILGVIILAMTLRNLDRDGKQMARILEEKGASLIKALEAGARTGMRHRLGTEMRMQVLVEEMAAQPDILFIMVTDHAGRVLAHSEPDKQGAVVFSPEDMSQLQPDEAVSWRIMAKENTRAFVVYRRFTPLQGRESLRGRNGGHRHEDDPSPDFSREAPLPGQGGMGPMRNAQRGLMSFFTSPDSPPPVIYVGMDVTPFEQARADDRRHTIVMAAILLLLGFAGFTSLIWAQNVRRSRRMLKDSQAFSAEIIASLPDGLVLVDAAGRVAFLNDKAEGLLGVTLDSVRGKRPQDVLPAAVTGALAALNTHGRLQETEAECRLAGGSDVPVGISGARVLTEDAPGETNRNGSMAGHVGDIIILRDLSEVRRLQQEVRRKEKLAAIGSLAAGVAHEIRNPLSSIKGYATYFGTRFPEDSEDRAAAGILVQEVDRLNRVITDLIGLARPSDLNRVPTDVAGLANHCLRLLGPDAAAQGVSLALKSTPQIPPVDLDPDRFAQALLNICLNGMEAMPGGGSLSLHIDTDETGMVRVRVSDTGHGISPEARERIFDPYFTTKSQGTGLGLAIVHKIVEAHGGTVHAAPGPLPPQGEMPADGTEGRGTTFTILLPPAQPQTTP